MRVPYAATRRYEELLDLPSHQLVAHIDTLYRYAASTGGASPVLRRAPEPLASPDRLAHLIDLARSSAAPLTGVEWDELTRRFAVVPDLVVMPSRTWSDIAERLLRETIVADGVAWMQRYEALSRLLAHPAGQQAAVAACTDLANDRTNQVFVETVGALDASDHPDASRHVLRQLTHPTNERAQFGALLASVRKLRLGHFSHAQLPALVPAVRELACEPAWREDMQPLAVEVLRNLPGTASAVGRRHLRRLVADPTLTQVHDTDWLAGADACQRVVERIDNAVVNSMPGDPPFHDDVLPVLLDEMLFSPVFDVRMHAALAVRGTPYRNRLATVLSAEVVDRAVLASPVATAMIEALRLIGGTEQRMVVERLITAGGMPNAVTVGAAQAIGHVGGRSDDRFWLSAIAHHAGQWRQNRKPTSAAVLNSLTYGLGIARNMNLLAGLRDDSRMPEHVRTAATWWLSLPEVVYLSADMDADRSTAEAAGHDGGAPPYSE